MDRKLTNPLSRRSHNPTHQPHCDGFRWNVSWIAEATGFHRDTVRRKLHDAGVVPCGHVANSPLYELRQALPAVFDRLPRQ